METAINQPHKKTESGFIQLLFFVCSVIFNLAISGLYLAVKFDNHQFLQICGITVVLLILPYSVTLAGFIQLRSEKRVLIMNMIVLFYLIVELFLDYLFKIPFREIPAIHIPYIIIFYAAAYSMILTVWINSRIKGIVVLGTFFILMISLIYMFS